MTQEEKERLSREIICARELGDITLLGVKLEHLDFLLAENDRLNRIMPRIGETCKHRDTYTERCADDNLYCMLKDGKCRNNGWELKE